MFKDLRSPYLIAEIGINHNGSLEIAKKLIDATSGCQWDCAKFQKRNPNVCVPEDQKSILRDTPWGRMSYLEYKYRVEFGFDEYKTISNECRSRNLSWTASVWDYDSLEFIMENFPEVPFLKIPSAINRDKSFLKEVCASNKPLCISLGMASLEDCDVVFDIVSKDSSDFCLMHTNSAYPCPNRELNISLIPFFKERYQCPIGYSGHEIGLEPSVIAATMGALVIERHVTLSHSMWGSDHACSLEVHAMDMLRKRIFEAIESVGNPIKSIFASEEKSMAKLKNDNIRRSR